MLGQAMNVAWETTPASCTFFVIDRIAAASYVLLGWCLNFWWWLSDWFQILPFSCDKKKWWLPYLGVQSIFALCFCSWFAYFKHNSYSNRQCIAEVQWPKTLSSNFAAYEVFCSQCYQHSRNSFMHQNYFLFEVLKNYSIFPMLSDPFLW